MEIAAIFIILPLDHSLGENVWGVYNLTAAIKRHRALPTPTNIQVSYEEPHDSGGEGYNGPSLIEDSFHRGYSLAWRSRF
jgi:hypothetical protein